jgi:hypothetical protein
MNEKIKELIEQSYEDTVVTTIDPVTQEVVTDYIDGTKPIFNKEKFAELVLKEAMLVCRTEWVSDSSAQKYGNQCADSIKQHFGVEL